MIVAKIYGGLGNQMFQYAMARSLANRRKVGFKLDLSWFERKEDSTERELYLDRFNIVADRATAAEVDRLLKMRKTLGRDIYNALVPFSWKKYVKMRDFSPFDPRYFKVGKEVYLEGYWTDERYFCDASDIIKKEFTLRQEMTESNKKIAAMIEASPCPVSIHIRRGDYITNDLVNRLFHVCGKSYYLRAIDEMKRRVGSPRFFVFSDDIEWVKSNIDTGCETCYVSDMTRDLPHEELILMSRCRHNIIANSTFSWWGAWLNGNESKVVIAPARWYNRAEYEGGECVPASWVKISTN